MHDDDNETFEADPELLAELKRQAASERSHVETARSGDNEDTTNADPELLADLKRQAARRQAAAQDSHAEAPAEVDRLWRMSDDLDQIEADQIEVDQIEHADDGDGADGDQFESTGEVDVIWHIGGSEVAPHRETADPERVDKKPVASLASTPLPPTKNSASEFVRQARETSTAPDQSATAAAPRKPRRSGLTVMVAVILGAQILALGTFLTLRSLQPAEEVAEEVATTNQVDDLAALTPTPAATGATAVPLQATPTSVPPTPQWKPSNQGPRLNPFSFVVYAVVDDPKFYDQQEGTQITPPAPGNMPGFESPLPSGEPLTLQVVRGEPGDEWAVVSLPGSDDRYWINTEEFSWRSTNIALQVDLSSNRIRVFEGNELVHIGVIASGSVDTPTQQIQTWVTENPADHNKLGLNDPVLRLAKTDASKRQLTIGLSDDVSKNDGYNTDGVVLVQPDTAQVIFDNIIAGSKVEFVGSAPRPTPTPYPTPTRNPQISSGGGGGSSSGCPSRAQGTPPNCYRIVSPQKTKGSCESYQVEITNSCMLLGGSVDRYAEGTGCPEAAPLLIEGFCYVRVGPVPQVPGDCPERAERVGDECHLPI